MNQIKFLPFTLLIIFTVTTLFGCSANYGRYQQRNDSKPTRKPTSIELKDATPRAEKKSRGGNKSYQVRGKHYNVLDTAHNFKQTGTASWYGKKFHGHLTSNGEIYNMYGMSAAHKNLPLPTYLKVTNNDNQKTVIVRVNDRGPFHQERILDLSYSAAYKLDMLKTGTANVTIEAITNFSAKHPTQLTSKNLAKDTYIQVFASRKQHIAQQTASALTSLYQYPAISHQALNVYKVRLGPIKESQALTDLLKQLKSNGYPNAFIVTK